MTGDDGDGESAVGGRKRGPVGFERVKSDRSNDGDDGEERVKSRRDFSFDGSFVAIVLVVCFKLSLSNGGLKRGFLLSRLRLFGLKSVGCV